MFVALAFGVTAVAIVQPVAAGATGIAWRDLPQEYGYGSGVTCWRRLRDWQKARGVGRAASAAVGQAQRRGKNDWSRAAVDGSHVRTPFWGLLTGSSRLTVSARAPSTISSSTHRGSRRRCADRRQPPRRHPADPVARRAARPTGHGQGRPSTPESPTGCSAIAAMTTTNTGSAQGPGHHAGHRPPWRRTRIGTRPAALVVERGFAHLHNFRRLRIRYERDPAIHEVFLTLACAILCWRRLNSF